MHVDGLGDVVANGEWWQSEPVALAYIDGAPVAFRIDAAALQAAPSDVADAVVAFLRLSSTDRLAAGRYVHASYLDTADAIRSRPEVYLPAWQPVLDLPIRMPSDVWPLVEVGTVDVERREEDGLIYVSVSLHVPWDEEHGIQIVYRRGRELSRVSSMDGHLTTADAYALPEANDRVYFSRADVLRRLEERRR